MHQNDPNYNSNIHFGPPGFLGGALGGQNGFLAGRGGFSEARAFIFFLNVLYWSTTKFWGGVTLSNFDFTHLSIHPNGGCVGEKVSPSRVLG